MALTPKQLAEYDEDERRLLALAEEFAADEAPTASRQLRQEARQRRYARESSRPRVEQGPVSYRQRSSWMPRNGQRLPAIVALVAALGGGAGISQACSGLPWKGASSGATKEEFDALKKRVATCEGNVSQLFGHAEQARDSVESERVAIGAAWRKNPVGEVEIRGFDQDKARVYSESMGDEKSRPIWRVSTDVKPYPKVPQKR